MDAIILDGGKSKFDYLSPGEAKETRKKLLLKLIDAFDAARNIGKIVLVTSSELEFKEHSAVKAIFSKADNSVVQNISLGLKHVDDTKDRILICTSDIPLVDGKLIDRFIMQALELDADIVYPIITREAVENYSLDIKRTFINLKDGSYTGGNIFMVTVDGVKKTLPKIEHVYSIRKSPKKLVKTLGILFVVKLLLKRLNIEQLEARCTSLLGVKCRALISEDAELGIDVDKQGDLEAISGKL